MHRSCPSSGSQPVALNCLVRCDEFDAAEPMRLSALYEYAGKRVTFAQCVAEQQLHAIACGRFRQESLPPVPILADSASYYLKSYT